MLHGSLDFGEESPARGIARLDARARIAACPTFRLGAGKRNEAAVEARRGPSKARFRRALIPPCVRAKRHLQFNQTHAASVIAVRVGSRNPALESPSLQWRHSIGDPFARKARTEVESGLAQIFIWRHQTDAS